MEDNQLRQKTYYDRHTKPLAELHDDQQSVSTTENPALATW